jgi:hypothetical protein
MPTNVTVQDAKQQALTFLEAHGRLRLAILLGGASAALGTIVPFAHVAGFFGSGESYSIVGTGFYGILFLVISLALGAYPIFLKQYARFQLAVFGLSCAIFGVFMAVWLASSGLAGTIAGELGGFSLGFYLSLLGYAAMVIGYYMLQHSPVVQEV